MISSLPLSTSFLETLISILRNNISENPEQDKITKCLETMNHIAIEDSLSIVAPETFDDNQSFNSSINKDLKYVLTHCALQLTQVTQKNHLILLLCEMLKDIIINGRTGLDIKIIKEMYIIITNALILNNNEQEDFLIRCCILASDFMGSSLNHYYTINFLLKFQMEKNHV